MRKIWLLAAAFIGSVYVPFCFSECSKDPVESAKSLYEEGFYFYAWNVPAVHGLFSPGAQKILQTYYQCLNNTDSCVVDYVPWLDAQDGGAFEPFRFETIVTTQHTAEVSFIYNFGFSSEHIIKPQTVKILFIQSGSCWLIDDFITPTGHSLFHDLSDGSRL